MNFEKGAAGGQEGGRVNSSVEKSYNGEEARLRGWEKALSLFEKKANKSFEEALVTERLNTLVVIIDDINTQKIEVSSQTADALGALMFATEHDFKAADAHTVVRAAYPTATLN